MMSNNRVLTLAGVQSIFEPVGIVIERHEMDYYYAELDGVRLERQTLIEICQAVLLYLRDKPSRFSEHPPE
jgi:hypothetical protein